MVKLRNIILIITIITLGICQIASAEVIRMKINAHEAKGAPMGVSADYFAKRINELTKGKVEAKVFYRGVLGAEMATMEAMLAGNIDISWHSNTITTNVVPDMASLDLPYNMSGIEHTQKLFNGPLGAFYNGLAREKGIIILGWAFAGSRCLLLRDKPVVKVSDLKGMKIRVPANPLYLETIKSWGANPTTISWNEAYLALSQGVVDGIETAPGPSFDKKHYEVAKYLLPTRHLFYYHLLQTSVKKFNTWPRDVQAAVMVAGAEAAALDNRLRIEQEKNIFAEYEKKGVKVLVPEIKGFMDATKVTYPLFKDKASEIMINLIKEIDK